MTTLATSAARTPPAPPAVETRPAPPDLPDARPVINGCFVSALSYANRFKAEYPGEHAETLTVFPRRRGFRLKPHTVALISWRGQWWLRDETFGVASLRLPVATTITPERIAARAEAVCEKHAEVLISRGTVHPALGAPTLTAAQRYTEVLAAASLLPVDSQLFWIEARTGRIPLLFFRPQPGWIAVYDPQNGTAVAETASQEARRIVPVVAARLGYDLTHPDAPEAAEPEILRRPNDWTSIASAPRLSSHAEQ